MMPQQIMPRSVALCLLLAAAVALSLQPGACSSEEELMENKLLELESEVAAISGADEEQRYVDAINTRCRKSIKIDLNEFEPSYGLLTSDNTFTWMNYSFTDDQIRASGYDPLKATIVIAPGFTQHVNSTWVRAARKLIVANGHVHKDNYIFMNWSKAAIGGYIEVSARARPMGLLLGKFLERLIAMGADRRRIHLIGHSISVHLVGFAAKSVRPKIGRITAIDPAGPCFGKWIDGAATHDRLAADDALQVDVTHYDDKLLGFTGSVGQIDVFVNGGSRQPGCPGPVRTTARFLAILVFNLNKNYSPAHSRSTEVASTQLSGSQCQHVAYECPDYDTFLAGACAHCDPHDRACFFMGFPFQYKETVPEQAPLEEPTTGLSRKFFIVVDKNKHFCTQHYQLLVEFEASERLASEALESSWRMQVELSAGGQTHEAVVTHRLRPNVFSYLLLAGDSPPQRFTEAKVKVFNAYDKPIPLHGWPVSKLVELISYRVKSVQVNYMSNIDHEQRQRFSARLCPVDYVIDSEADKRMPKLRFDEISCQLGQ